MAETRELLSTLFERKENQCLALEEDLILHVTTRICQLMEQKSVSRSELAKELRVTRAYVTGLLSGSRNMTLRTLADVFFALGRKIGFNDRAIARTDFVSGHSQNLVGSTKKAPLKPRMNSEPRASASATKVPRRTAPGRGRQLAS